MAPTPIASCVQRYESLTRAAAGAVVVCTMSVMNPPICASVFLCERWRHSCIHYAKLQARVGPLCAYDATPHRELRECADFPNRNGPAERGHSSKVGVRSFCNRRDNSTRVGRLGPYRPKRGRSPLWLEISALAISKRSTAAMKRANSEAEGA